MTRRSSPAFRDDLGSVSFWSMLMFWCIGRKHELLLDTNREIASELTKEKTKYRWIPCLVKGRQENAEYTYEEGQQILIYFNSGTNVLLARQYATSRMVPSTVTTVARHGDAVTEHSRQKWRYWPLFYATYIQYIIRSVYLLLYIFWEIKKKLVGEYSRINILPLIDLDF